MNKLTLVVFDMAGTTVLDRGEVPAAFTAVLAAQGIEVTPEAPVQRRPPAQWKRQAILSLIAEGLRRKAQDRRQLMPRSRGKWPAYVKDAEPVPGAAETFAWLRRPGA